MKMNCKTLNFLIAVILVLFSGCKDGFEAFEGSGKTVVISRPVMPFQTVSVNDNINLVIAYDTAYTLKVEAGKNWMDDIITEVNANGLVLKSNLNFLWLKDPDKEITVYITVPSLENIFYQGTGWVHTKDTLYADQLTVEARDGGGSIKLNVHATTLNLKSVKGVVDIEAQGITDNLYVFSDAVSPVNCIALERKNVTVISGGTNDCYVNVQHVLEAHLSGVGDVFYKGNPDSILSEITGTGRLI